MDCIMLVCNNFSTLLPLKLILIFHLVLFFILFILCIERFLLFEWLIKSVCIVGHLIFCLILFVVLWLIIGYKLSESTITIWIVLSRCNLCIWMHSTISKRLFLCIFYNLLQIAYIVIVTWRLIDIWIWIYLWIYIYVEILVYWLLHTKIIN